MPAFLIRRVLTMVLTALCLTFVVFYLTNLPPNLEKLAKSEASARMSDADVESWIERNGYGRVDCDLIDQQCGYSIGHREWFWNQCQRSNRRFGLDDHQQRQRNGRHNRRLR